MFGALLDVWILVDFEVPHLIVPRCGCLLLFRLFVSSFDLFSFYVVMGACGLFEFI